MTLDLACLHKQVVLITNLAKYFNAIAQDVHHPVGRRIGLDTKDHFFAHAMGNKKTMPLGHLQSKLLEQLLGIPWGAIHGFHTGATAASPFVNTWAWCTESILAPQWLTP